MMTMFRMSAASFGAESYKLPHHEWTFWRPLVPMRRPAGWTADVKFASESPLVSLLLNDHFRGILQGRARRILTRQSIQECFRQTARPSDDLGVNSTLPYPDGIRSGNKW